MSPYDAAQQQRARAQRLLAAALELREAGCSAGDAASIEAGNGAAARARAILDDLADRS